MRFVGMILTVGDRRGRTPSLLQIWSPNGLQGRWGTFYAIDMERSRTWRERCCRLTRCLSRPAAPNHRLGGQNPCCEKGEPAGRHECVGAGDRWAGV